MISTITENDLKETFGTKVNIECDGFINYRAYEESLKGIEQLIKDEVFSGKRRQLIRIRKDMKKILDTL